MKYPVAKEAFMIPMIKECAAGAGDWKAASLYGNNIDPGVFLQSRRTKATSLCDHAYEA